MLPIFAVLFNPPAAETPVRATLADGQILMGEVVTRTLRLQSGVGLLEIPLADVGEVAPARGGDLGQAEGRVDVWLRNGSELRGTWADPKLAMSIAVGGKDVGIDLPMNDLHRFQLQGGSDWPEGPVYRMVTRFGDDFLVDPARTHLVLESELGVFTPLLTECRMVGPVGDPEGAWRVELKTGTVLLGKLQDDTLTVALPSGPEEISVALADFVSLRVESWGPVYQAPQLTRDHPERGADRSSAAPRLDEGLSAAPVTVESTGQAYRGLSTSGGAPGASRPSTKKAAAPTPAADEDVWFDSSALEAAKEAEAADTSPVR